MLSLIGRARNRNRVGQVDKLSLGPQTPECGDDQRIERVKTCIRAMRTDGLCSPILAKARTQWLTIPDVAFPSDGCYRNQIVGLRPHREASDERS